MSNRFLKYSLDKQCKIRAMFWQNGALIQKNVTVLSLDGTVATLRIGAQKKPVTVDLADILSCDYARGDHGGED